ncbi:MAG: ATP-binding protein, partial [Undibacterium sp.]|nr:ATP-binding protein [Opitutaceae bacterium]
WALAAVSAEADPVLLRSILGNLFDNAVDYTPAGGTIGIGLAATAQGGVAVSVVNPAEGLEPADVARLFDRFWRKEAARTGGSHVGLGLSLARTFATAMGWTLTAALEGRRLGFTLAGPGDVRARR